MTAAAATAERMIEKATRLSEQERRQPEDGCRALGSYVRRSALGGEPARTTGRAGTDARSGALLDSREFFSGAGST